MGRGQRRNDVLRLLAVNGPMNVYQIWRFFKKSLGISKCPPRSSFQKAIDSLASEGFVEVKESRGWYGGNRAVKTYGLTLEGLLEALKDDDLWGDIDKIAEKNMLLLPEYFRLWGTFKEVGVEETAVKLLAYTMSKLQRGVPTFPEKIEGRRPTLRDWLPRLAIYPWDAHVDKVLTKKEASRFLCAIMGDQEADKLYVETFKWMIESHSSALEHFKKALESYEELKFWVDAAVRFAQLFGSGLPLQELLETIRGDEKLWKIFMQFRPEVEGVEDIQAIIEKIYMRRGGFSA